MIMASLPVSWLLCLLLSSCIVSLSNGNEELEKTCGGYFTSSRGIIQTPHFPGPFIVPIKCRWVIDASDISDTNNSIVVYLTQLYVYKGLKFIEYAYYESESTNFGATLLKKITEGNVLEYRWLKTNRPFLVIEFELDRLEGNHVRVLHDLLNVYGFNITYEMSSTDPNPTSCTVRECSYAGNCILGADYNIFSCVCFDEFQGEKCSNGPLCIDRRNAICHNGGTCSHVGAHAIRCQCPPDTTGANCEIPIRDKIAKECGEDACILQCPVDHGTRPCGCKEPIPVYNNRARYECRIKLSNVTSLRSGATSQPSFVDTLLRKQLAKYLRNSEISTMEDLKILSVTPSAEVTFHFFGNATEGDKIRDALNRLVQRRRLSDFTLESTHFTFQQKPALKLQDVYVNHALDDEVRLGGRLTISCLAQGSSGIKFIWYKDNMIVNTSKATREIWYKILPNDEADTYISVLTIDEVTLLDAGEFTCQIIDWGMQQCQSIYIKVRDEPNVRVVPMSATIEKGNNIQLMCITPNMQSLGIGFGWTKNRALLKLDPKNQVWEDLYPAGSILKIMNAQKSAIYTCNVAHRSMSVRIDVVNRTLIPICSNENSWGMRWPDTGPGSEALLECPRQFVGQQVSRLCSMKDATTPVWQYPDFSECLYEPFISPYGQFRSLAMGYQNTTGADTIMALWEILRSRKLALYPGEGDRILRMLAEIEHYQYTVNELDELHHSAEMLIRIVNRILGDEKSVLLHESQLLLQQITQRNLEIWEKQLVQPHKHLALTSVVIDIQRLYSLEDKSNNFFLQIPTDDDMYPYWYTDTVAIHLAQSDADVYEKNKTLSGIIIVYKNITRFLPSTFVTVLEDGTDLEYRFNSRVITVAVTPLNEAIDAEIQINLKMHLLQNRSRAWNVSCGMEDMAGSWDLNSCITKLIPEESAVKCTCSSPGTFAVFLTARAVKVAFAKNKRSTFIVLLGCGCCLLQCIVSSLVLGFYWWKIRTWLNFLKLQFSTALGGAMAIFIYAIHNTLSEGSYAMVAVSLETCLLIGMSAPISQALIIYANLIETRQSKHFQPTVIAVITGLPMLCILTTELMHKSTGWRHESWWLIFGSEVYNIFLSCVATMLSLFMILYTGVLRKAHTLVQKNVLKKDVAERRISLIHRAAIIIYSLILMGVASIFYINSTSVIFHYMFASLSAFLGFIVLFVYIGNSQLLLITPILCKFKLNNIDKNMGSDLMKGNDNIPPSGPASINGPIYTETRGTAAGSINMRGYIKESKVAFKPTSLSNYAPDVRINRSDNINLENYHTSPRKYQEPFNRLSQDPAEFYVGSRSSFNRDTQFPMRDPPTTPSQVISPECSAKLLCSADIELRMSTMPDVTLATTSDVELSKTPEIISRDHADVVPDIASTGERKQPDGEEMTPEIIITDCGSNTTGMLDRISHDLDYLLNRKQASEEI